MSSFLRDAEEIFETASQGREDCQLAILVGRDGGIHMASDSGWDLDCLRQHHGASRAFRVIRTGGRVHLEARETGQSCTLRSEPAERILRSALAAQYLLAA